VKLTTYLILCLILSAVIIAAVLFIPGVGEMIESRLLSFLSTNAS
jgi:hypothetical protein